MFEKSAGATFLSVAAPHPIPMLTIYKASAGSGKTFTLSATFIAHLVSGERDNAHRHQLAVTFTNKATAEMKERILQNLYAIAFGDNDNDGFLKAVKAELPDNVTVDTIRRRAKTELFALIHDYDHFHVKTIDSFFQSLLSNLAHEVQLSANFKVEIDDKNILATAVDRFLEGVSENSDELDWLMEYISQRLEGDSSWNVSGILRDLSKELLKEKYMRHRHLLHRRDLSPEELAANPESINLENKVVNDYQQALRKKARELRKKLAQAAQQADDAINRSLGYGSISNGQRWVQEPIQRAAREDIPYGDLNDFSSTFRSYADGSKTLLLKKYQNDGTRCQQADMVREYLQRLVTVFDDCGYDINSCDLSSNNIFPLRLLDCIDHEVESLNRENDRFMLAYTPLLFDKLAGDADTSFIFERAGTQFDHVMIDEFQDTSPLQWQNMRHLLVENLAQGNSCMLVGDVKQGIYRFRGGDWSTLANFSEERHGDDTLVRIETLKRNFRSGREIVEFNNRVFTTAPSIIDGRLAELWGLDSENLPEDLSAKHIYPIPDPGNDSHEVTQKVVKEGGYVRVEFYSDADESGKSSETDEAECCENADAQRDMTVEDRLAEQISRLREEGVPYEEMAILIRNNSDSTRLLQHFEIHCPDIPLVSEEAFLLDASPAVQTLVHALKYVVNTTDNIAREYVVSRIPAEERDGVIGMLDRWNREHYSGLPFYEIVTRLMVMLHLDKMDGQSPYLYTFLDTILRHIDENTSDVKEFLKSWEENLHRTPLPSAAVKGVRILTIHKSKGLAFHTVLIPYNNWIIDDPKKPERVWTSPAEAPYNGIPLLPIDLRKTAENSIYRDVYRKEQYNRFIENLNLMYVAFTRAKQNLLVWCKQDKSEKSLNNMSILLRRILEKADMLASQGMGDDGDGGKGKPGKPADVVVELGSPSVREMKACCTSGKDDGTALPEHKTGNPLDFRADVYNVEYSATETMPHFRQSQSARLFIEMEQGLVTQDEDGTDREKREEFRLTGLLLHELMSTIQTSADVTQQVSAFVREGRLPEQRAESLKHLILHRLEHPLAREWFDGSWTLYREATLIFRDEDGQIVSRRPDRVMKRGNETIVVDFKFGRPKPEYAEQVRQYVSLLHRQGDTDVKAYLWYLYSGQIDEVTS